MATRFRRAKANAKVCKSCHREKGDRKRAKCPLCPGQAIADTLLGQPIRGVRLVVVDAAMERTGVVVTSPTYPGVLEHRCSFDPLTTNELDNVLSQALASSDADGAPIWLVIEDPGVGGSRAHPQVIFSIGQAVGITRRAWARAGGNDRRVVLVLQVSWQAGTGVARGTKDDRGARLEEAIARADEVWQDASGTAWDGDQACAAMLAWFVLRWPEFTERMTDRDREAAERVGAPVPLPAESCAELAAGLRAALAPAPAPTPRDQPGLFG